MKKWIVLLSTLVVFTLTIGVIPQMSSANDGQYKGKPGTHEMNHHKISKEEAEKIALNQVKGKAEIIHSELESDDGRLVYDFEIKTSDSVYEVEIDAKTGKVLEVEKEDGHDSDD